MDENYHYIKRKSDGKHYAVIKEQDAIKTKNDSFDQIYKCHPVKPGGIINKEELVLIKRSDMVAIK